MRLNRFLETSQSPQQLRVSTFIAAGILGSGSSVLSRLAMMQDFMETSVNGNDLMGTVTARPSA